MKKIILLLFLCAMASEESIKLDALIKAKATQLRLLANYFDGFYKDIDENESVYFPVSYGKKLEEIISDLKKEVAEIEDLFFESTISSSERRRIKQSLTFLKKELKSCQDKIKKLINLVDDQAKNLAHKISKDAESYKKIKEKFSKLNIIQANKDKILAKFQTFESGKADETLKKQMEYIMELPWDDTATMCTDLQLITNKLESTHAGMKEVKDQILDYIAVNINGGNKNAPVICLVGAPGVGKTSIAKSIADALNLPFALVSMGGVHDEAEVRGFNPTYQSSRPGRFIDALCHTKVKNPLILIDEIDKASALSNHGNPQAALLEILDPTQNNNFRDNYLEVGFDFSEVLFIATANSLADLPEALLNRMLVINLDSYSVKEKLNIAKKHLIKKVMQEVSLTDFSFSDDVLTYIIDNYTFEGGTRQLEKRLKTICSRVVRERLSNIYKNSIQITDLESYLGDSYFRDKNNSDKAVVGRINALSVLGYVGASDIIESFAYEGEGKIIYTGQQGDVMKESINVARTALISRAQKLGLDSELIKKSDLHINAVVNGKIDGSSAGAAFFTLLASVFTNKPIDQTVAITGKIDLSGNVLAIGGVREKISGAEKKGIKKVILPEQNRKDYVKVKDQFPGIEVFFVDNVDQVIGILLK